MQAVKDPHAFLAMQSESKNIPEIRFPEFQNAWLSRRLSELLSESKKRNFDSTYSRDEVLSVSGELGVVNQIDHLGRSYAGESILNYHVLESGDIVYTKSPLKANPYGIIKMNKGPSGIVSTLYAVYKVNPKTCDGSFLDYYFSLDDHTNRYLRPLVRKGAKNDMKISNSHVLSDPIFAPGLVEQRKIAASLSAVDKRIGQLAGKKGLLLKYKKGVMQQVFNQSIRFKDENGNDFPDWEERTLGEVGENIIGLTYSPNQVTDADNGIIVLRSSNIREDRLVLDDLVRVSSKINSKLEIRDNDILICTRNGSQQLIGKNILIDKIRFPMTFGAFMSVFRSDQNAFIVHLLKTDSYLAQVRANLGARINQITTKTLNSFRFRFPCIDEQAKIAAFLSHLQARIDLVDQQLKVTKAFKKGLLQQMFV